MKELEAIFSDLIPGTYQVTSHPSKNCNCVAWAAGKRDEFWWPLGKGIWPAGAPKEVTIEAFIKAFELQNYVLCDDGSFESEYEKIAIFALGSLPKHVARQLPSGRWTSKIGKDVDIEHPLHGLNGQQYGVPVRYMRRPKTTAPKKPAKKQK